MLILMLGFDSSGLDLLDFLGLSVHPENRQRPAVAAVSLDSSSLLTRPGTHLQH